MAETLGKKAAKKASGKKRGRPRNETVQACRLDEAHRQLGK